MQDAAFARIKAGASWRDIHLHMHRIVIEGLLELGVLISGPSKNTGKALEDELYEKNLSVPFLPHGLGHNLGLDVRQTASL
jgi:Xaa-Pro dipeptidase